MPMRTWGGLIALAAVGALGVTALLAVLRVGPDAPMAASVLPADQPQSTATEAAYPLPAFTLTNQMDQQVTRDDLLGRVWVADFIFTRCMGPCPVLTHNMAQLRDRLRDEPGLDLDQIRLVSFSVDPEHDTPQVLRDYAQRYGAEPSQWWFLTGPREALWPLIEQGFKLAVSDDPTNTQMPIAHSTKWALVDKQGVIRGYYSGLDERDQTRLIADLRRLLEEP
ncbi:MAG TPA: SCO family protein [Phycisphaeraceae bacterium]